MSNKIYNLTAKKQKPLTGICHLKSKQRHEVSSVTEPFTELPLFRVDLIQLPTVPQYFS